MVEDKSQEPLSEERRKEIFLALVDAQDQALGVPQSRQLIAERFGAAPFDVVEGECVVFVGPSGCGKTTTLKLTNQLLRPTRFSPLK